MPPAAAAPVNAPKWPAGQLLQLGNKGNAVTAMQHAFHDSGIRGVRGLDYDGIFGQNTLTAVKNFQRAEGLSIDGVAGSQTRSALVSIGRLNSAGQALG